MLMYAQSLYKTIVHSPSICTYRQKWQKTQIGIQVQKNLLRLHYRKGQNLWITQKHKILHENLQGILELVNILF